MHNKIMLSVDKVEGGQEISVTFHINKQKLGNKRDFVAIKG